MVTSGDAWGVVQRHRGAHCEFWLMDRCFETTSFCLKQRMIENLYDSLYEIFRVGSTRAVTWETSENMNTGRCNFCSLRKNLRDII